MNNFNPIELKKLYVPPAGSHKGANGRLTIIGGSHLFHGASLWALKVASRIVDMVFYSSVPENNELTQQLKGDFYDFIAVPREDVEKYIEESDTVLIGPGMLRTQHSVHSSQFPSARAQGEGTVHGLEEINKIRDEGEQTYYLTKYLLHKYPHKKWVIDAGALQMMEVEWLKQLKGNVVVTPHHKEFERLFHNVIPNESEESPEASVQRMGSSRLRQLADPQDDIIRMAGEYNCIILFKGQSDLVCSPEQCVEIVGGNAGMTKGGTGDVLAGLVAALACKNELFLAASAASYINKKAGDELYQRVGPYFNASDLADQIPRVMKELLNTKVSSR